MFDKTLYWSGQIAVKTYARVMLRTEISWHTPLPAGPKIIVLNHPTTTDPFLVTMLLEERAYILISETLFKVPVLGRYLQATHHIPVAVGNGRAAFDAARQLLHAGKTIVIFPEGEISPPTGGLHKPHTGAARLALITGVPVIPVGIYLQRERIRYIHTTVDSQPEVARWYLRGPYTMTVGVPLYFKGDVENRDYVTAIANNIMENIAWLAQQSEARTYSRLNKSTSWRLPLRPELKVSWPQGWANLQLRRISISGQT